LAVYTDRYTWAKYGHHILPSTILLNQNENLQTRSLYRNALQQLLCTDLDGNLSTSLNPPTKAKLDEYVSTFFRGKSKSTTLFGAKIKEIALTATIIPRSLFINVFAKKFPKHEYLESTHELMQQVHIELKTEPGQCCLFLGDLSIL
jgi:hypothetical protein